MDDILHYNDLGNIILTGDFNAHTGTLFGYVFHDAAQYTKTTHCQTPDIYTHDQAVVRNNIDCTTKESGKLLASLCVESGFRISNGRTLVIPWDSIHVS